MLNSRLMVGALVAFRFVHGSGGASLHLTTGEKLLLAAAGTLGVAAFVAVPVVAVLRSGFRLRPRLSRRRNPKRTNPGRRKKPCLPFQRR